MTRTLYCKDDVLALALALSRGRGDTGMMDQYYEDITYEMAKQEILTAAVVTPMVGDTGGYNFPDDAVDLLAVIYDNIQLGKSGRQEIEWQDRGWRARVGRPKTYLFEDETLRTFRLYPKPEVSSHDMLWSGMPLGNDYPVGSAVVIYTQKRHCLPEYYTLYAACEILSREFKRESDHMDLKFAEACEQLSRLFFQMVQEK